MARYGHELLMLDATYKCMRYALPLFFLVVPTNFDYQIVAVFITETEQKIHISEALAKIHEWNDMSIQYAMTDYCLSEIGALEEVWEGKHSLEGSNKF